MKLLLRSDSNTIGFKMSAVYVIGRNYFRGIDVTLRGDTYWSVLCILNFLQCIYTVLALSCSVLVCIHPE